MTPTSGPVGKSLYMVIALGAFLFFGYSISKRARFVAKAKSDNRLDKPILRTLDLLPWVVGNLRVARPRFWYSGILHTFILWGFIVLQVRTFNFLLEGVSERITLQKLGGWLYRPLMPVMDLFNLLVLVGVGMAAARRLLFPPKRLTVTKDGYIILGFTTAMMVTDIMANATKIALERPSWGPWSPVALVVSWIFRGLGGGLVKGLHGAFWFLHLISFLGFLNYLPYSKHSHVLTGHPQRPLQIPEAFRSARTDPGLRDGGELRRRQAPRPKLEAASRFLHLHGVRTVHGGLSGQRHRETAITSEDHHGHPPPGRR